MKLRGNGRIGVVLYTRERWVSSFYKVDPSLDSAVFGFVTLWFNLRLKFPT